VDALVANAGRGLGRGFLDQDPGAWRHVVDTNITGTLLLVQKVGRDMRRSGAGRILITGSIAGFIPGTYQAVNNGTKAFLDSFSFALRHELKDAGVSVTCLMPRATETDFFERADMMDTKAGQQRKDDAAKVAQTFHAMMKGEGDSWPDGTTSCSLRSRTSRPPASWRNCTAAWRSRSIRPGRTDCTRRFLSGMTSLAGTVLMNLQTQGNCRRG
jgi:short-subunit dehydrogenase